MVKHERGDRVEVLTTSRGRTTISLHDSSADARSYLGLTDQNCSFSFQRLARVEVFGLLNSGAKNQFS